MAAEKPLALPNSERPVRLNPWLCSLLAGLAACGMNVFGLPIFGGTELLFGGWLPLLIAYAYGAGPAALAGTLAFSVTAYNWGHPWGLICFGLEPVFVGWFVHRYSGRIRASALYWALIGTPLSILGVLWFTDIPFPGNWAIIAKYPLNSSLMLLIALPLFRSRWSERWLGRRDSDADKPLQRVLFQRFGVIIALTLAALAISVGSNFDRTQRRFAEEALERDTLEAARDIGEELRTHQQALSVAVRDSRPDSSPAELARRLENLRREYRGFLTLLATDAQGRIVAAAPALNTSGEPVANGTLSVADRRYFTEAMRTGEPFMSEVFLGRGFGADLIVALSQAVRDTTGRTCYVIEGSLNLSALLDPRHAPGYIHGRSALVLDDRGQVVVSVGDLARPTLSTLATDPLMLARQNSSRPTFSYDHARSGHRRERLLVSDAAITGTGWHVYLAEPIWATQRLVAAFYLVTIVIAIIALSVALFLARGAATHVTRPLNQVVASIQALSQNETAAPFLPSTQPAAREIEALTRAAHEAALLLSRTNRELGLSLQEQSKTHAQLRQVLLHLDEKVRQRTEQLEIARAHAESANRAKSEFIASTSHELRTPLNVILGMSEVLIDRTLGELTPRQHESIAAIEESGRHLLALINDILDLSKIEAGKLELNIQEADVRDICEASLRLVRQAAHHKGHTLDFTYLATVTVCAADSRRVKQILVNLLSNAVKFTPDGGQIRLKVTQSHTPAELQLSVSDNGIGIAPEHQAELFQPFHQIDGALTRRHGGTGLGLTLARRMAELHGGHLTFVSAPGRGSTFTVTLPIQAAAPAHPLPSTLPKEKPYVVPPGTHVLVAEDNETNILIYQHNPLFSACRFTIARDGREAVDLALAEPPDLILMDVHMPVLDGLAATRQLRADPRTAKIPIIVITALAMADDRTRCLEAGATSYLSKPVKLRDLSQHVADALQHPTHS